MENARNFIMSTISQNLSENYPSSIKKVRIYNFQDGQIIFDLLEMKKKKTIGVLSNCWIRLYDYLDNYYDFITSSVFFDLNDSGLVLLCSEDTEFITSKKIKLLLKDFVTQFNLQELSNDLYVKKYLSFVREELKIASRELVNLYNVAKKNDKNVFIDETYEFGRAKLVKKYLLNLILVKLLRENHESIILTDDE